MRSWSGTQLVFFEYADDRESLCLRTVTWHLVDRFALPDSSPCSWCCIYLLAMGRSRLARSLQHLGRGYVHPGTHFYRKLRLSGIYHDFATVSSGQESLPPSASYLTEGGSVSRRYLIDSTFGNLHSGNHSTQRFHTSVATASQTLLDAQRDIRSSKLRLSPSEVRQACWCKQRCTISSGANEHGSKETISVTFVNKDGEEKTIPVPVGMSMLEAAHENDIELEGACEGSLACSTCHVIVMEDDMYGRLPEPSDEENDMLDLAFGLTETSRLGCQVIAVKELDGLRLALPAATRNFAVDGHVPKPH